MSCLSLAVVVAALNEEEGIAPTICELKEVLHQPNLLVVDGKSTDRTLEVAKDLGVEIIIQSGTGKGNAIYEGINQLKEGTSYVVLTDADYTYPAKHLKEMINILDLDPRVGMVLGDRFSKIFEFESDRNQFFIGNRILGFIQRVLNGIKLNDPYTGLRIVRYKLLKDWKPNSSGFDAASATCAVLELRRYTLPASYPAMEFPNAPTAMS